jgi:hypothetical protein
MLKWNGPKIFFLVTEQKFGNAESEFQYLSGVFVQRNLKKGFIIAKCIHFNM